MRTSHILLLCILGYTLLATVLCINGIGPDDCCFEHYTRTVDKRLIRSYIVTDRRCPKTAVVLLTKRSRRICVDPNRSWVKSIMGMVDKRTF
ncbi:C-C motif chemokine 3-like [Sebastes umbrosus]|uniref:C-C motif chemokine 3-like n=1 Tax=Sebastes umbrosus TaxID=72105 RepID=UPI00189ED8C6|nr:C-C motif chemokine 3-like [Sebastes umbrosus]